MKATDISKSAYINAVEMGLTHVDNVEFIVNKLRKPGDDSFISRCAGLDADDDPGDRVFCIASGYGSPVDGDEYIAWVEDNCAADESFRKAAYAAYQEIYHDVLEDEIRDAVVSDYESSLVSSDPLIFSEADCNNFLLQQSAGPNEPETYTKLTLFYRDADNYKMYDDVLLHGAITPEQVEFILKKTRDLGCDSMIGHGVVIADQIGLPTPAEGMMDVGSKGWPNPDADHVFTEIIEFERVVMDDTFAPGKLAESLWFKTDEQGRTSGATVLDLTVDQLVSKIGSIDRWNVDKEMTRQAMIGNYSGHEAGDYPY